MEKLLQKAVQKVAIQVRSMNRDWSQDQAAQYAKYEVFENWAEMSVDFIGLDGLSNDDYFLHDGSMSRPTIFGRYFDFVLSD